jgi:hypothetical protein
VEGPALKNVKAALPVIVIVLLLLSVCPLGVASPNATVFVDPEKSNVEVGQTFSVNVSIANVSGLLGYDFLLSYNASVLDLVSVGEGSFLKSVGSTFMINLTTRGLVWLAVAVYNPQGEIVPANGAGVLAVATFKAIAEGQSSLDLFSKDPYRPDEIKLVADPPVSVVLIPNVAIDGHVTIVPDPPQTPSDPPTDPPPTVLVGDINADGIVDMKDLGYVARLFGTESTRPLWDAKADVNGDGRIDMRDVGITSRNLWKTNT